MNGTRELTFASPSFVKRLRGMLGVDFYRLFHTPMFYIFLGIAAIIPALVSMGGGEDGTMYTTMWNIIAADSPVYHQQYCGICQYEHGIYFRRHYGFHFHRS